jgi:hypothetical protein
MNSAGMAKVVGYFVKKKPDYDLFLPALSPPLGPLTKGSFFARMKHA